MSLRHHRGPDVSAANPPNEASACAHIDIAEALARRSQPRCEPGRRASQRASRTHHGIHDGRPGHHRTRPRQLTAQQGTFRRSAAGIRDVCRVARPPAARSAPSDTSPAMGHRRQLGHGPNTEHSAPIARSSMRAGRRSDCRGNRARDPAGPRRRLPPGANTKRIGLAIASLSCFQGLGTSELPGIPKLIITVQTLHAAQPVKGRGVTVAAPGLPDDRDRLTGPGASQVADYTAGPVAKQVRASHTDRVNALINLFGYTAADMPLDAGARAARSPPHRRQTRRRLTPPA